MKLLMLNLICHIENFNMVLSEFIITKKVEFYLFCDFMFRKSDHFPQNVILC